MFVFFRLSRLFWTLLYGTIEYVVVNNLLLSIGSSTEKIQVRHSFTA